MHVLFLTNKLVNGGGERVLLCLIQGVCAKGGVPTILFLGKRSAISSDIHREMEAAGARVVLASSPISAFRALKAATTLHLYNVNVYVKSLLFLPFIGNRRVICHVHGSAESANPVARKLFCADWNPCDEILFVSEAGKRSYELERGLVVPNPVVFPEVVRKEMVETGSHLRLLSVNRLVAVKRVGAQIEMLHVLRSDYGVDATLDIVGEGPELESLLARVKSLGLDQFVRFLGGCQHKAVLRLYQNYDAFLATSAAEGLGLSLIEALGAGLPAFAAPIPPFEEVAEIGGGVHFADPDNPKVAAETIVEALESGDFMPANNAALQRSFAPATFVKRITALYR